MPTPLGPIIRLQIQLSALKIGQKPHRYYVTDPILPVDRLRLTPDGAFGLTDRAELMDVHHRRHPLGKNPDGENPLSVGFTGHYAEMRERYGEHMTVGCAGENITVQLERRVEPGEAARGFVVLDQAGREKARLVRVIVADPCKSFSGFAHKREQVPPQTLKETLMFLDGGTRGFYCAFDGAEGADVVIAVGDAIALA